MTDIDRAAERVRRINNGETYRQVYETDSIGYLDRDRALLADAYAALAAELAEAKARAARFDDDTPIDEAWLRSIGFVDDPDRLWLQLVTPMGLDITWWRSDGEVSVSNPANGLELEKVSRGNLLHLLAGLGIERKGVTDA